jgi:PhoPQ-activated pathogenicity-related protein
MIARSRSPAMSDTSLVVVDPGHFHATLVQQQMYPGLSALARVYAPLGPDLIDYFNSLIGEKFPRYVPNTDHSLEGSDAPESAFAFYEAIVTGPAPAEILMELRARRVDPGQR